MYNSTIKPKTGVCCLCPPDKGEQPLIAGKCNYHYWLNSKLKSAAKQQEKEIEKDSDLATLVDDLDIIYSRYIRLKSADLYGNCKCVTCGKEDNYKYMQCGHFIPRQHFYTRFLEINTHVQCKNCNEHKRGNLAAYSKYLELLGAGTVEALQQQARIIYKYSRDELKSMIADYTRKVNKLLK